MSSFTTEQRNNMKIVGSEPNVDRQGWRNFALLTMVTAAIRQPMQARYQSEFPVFAIVNICFNG
jgi:hypothetical protein